MSPLKITLLLNLHTCGSPMQDYPEGQRDAPAMKQAVADFVREGLIQPDVTHASLCFEKQSKSPLTEKGEDLVTRLKLVEPKDAPKVSFARLNKVDKVLREEHRLKAGTDYSWTVKYDELRIFCAKVYEDTINDVMTHYDVPVTSFTTY